MPSFPDHFRLIAPHYDRFFTYQRDEHLPELLQCSGEGWLLDAGGGTGRVAETLRHLAGQVVILDESEGMLRQARGKGLITVCGEIEALPFRNDAISRILMVDTFHHLRDQTASAGELLRVLTAGGRLVVQEPDIRHWMVKLIALGEKVLLMRSRFRRPETVQRMFEAAGGRVRVQRGKVYFWLLAEKEPRS
ncbi:MAG: methyltransferase domain-containing protein [Anaerolineae bacterium]|nr:methyltransferase domain-containing protein [Anaerolineae bacterium]